MSKVALLVAGFVLLLCACGSVGDRGLGVEPVPAAVMASGPTMIDLELDRPIAFGDKRVVLRGIRDSRCPADVVCVWAGEVIVTIEVLGTEDDPEESVGLRIPERNGPSKAKVLDLEIRLLAVTPHPKADEATKPDRYRAHIEVSPAPKSA